MFLDLSQFYIPYLLYKEMASYIGNRLNMPQDLGKVYSIGTLN